MDFGLSKAIRQQLIACIQRYPAVTEAKIYGSRARGDYRPESDIDIAICGAALTSTEFAQLCWDIENLPIIFKIDVIHFDQITNQALRENIDRDGVAIR